MKTEFIELTQIQEVFGPHGSHTKESEIVGKISFSPDAIATFEETKELYPPKGFYDKDEISRDISSTKIRLKNSETSIFVAENYKRFQNEIDLLNQ